MNDCNHSGYNFAANNTKMDKTLTHTLFTQIQSAGYILTAIRDQHIAEIKLNIYIKMTGFQSTDIGIRFFPKFVGHDVNYRFVSLTGYGFNLCFNHKHFSS